MEEKLIAFPVRNHWKALLFLLRSIIISHDIGEII